MAEGDGVTAWRTEYLDRPDGVRLRLAHWPAAATPRATVLLLHGRTEFNEKYDETAGDLIALGFDVWSFDWRGQGMSTRLLEDRHKGHVSNYDLLVEDLRAVIEYARTAEAAGDAEPPVVLLAHSMGGLAAMLYLATGVADTAAVVLSAPLLGIGPGSFPGGLAKLLSRLAVLLGFGNRFALTQQRWRPGRETFEGNPLTSDPERYAVHQGWFRDKPELALGGVTWGWLDATIRSCEALLRPGVAARVTVPVMLGLAGADVVVSRSAISRMAALVPGAVLKSYAGGRHELMMERDDIRDAFLADFNTFLEDRGI